MAKRLKIQARDVFANENKKRILEKDKDDRNKGKRMWTKISYGKKSKENDLGLNSNLNLTIAKWQSTVIIAD